MKHKWIEENRQKIESDIQWAVDYRKNNATKLEEKEEILLREFGVDVSMDEVEKIRMILGHAYDWETSEVPDVVKIELDTSNILHDVGEEPED